jgi:hypothetical protein
MSDFQPDYRHIVTAARNGRPARLPLYEHHIDYKKVASTVMKMDMEMPTNRDRNEWQSYFEKVCRFWREMTYDTVSYECAICDILPGHGAIYGGMKGPIQNRRDFEAYPWGDLPRIFWEKYTPRLDALQATMPPGMKALGGCGFGIFEISEDLVGFEDLCVLAFDDPDLFADLYVRIGDLMVLLWTELLKRYGELFAVCRMGDDLGFKSSTLMSPDVLIEHVMPQLKRVVALAHAAGKPFLWHSCGRIFDVMEAAIGTGIDAKHSNEDQIATFDVWIEKYGNRLGLFGGIDVNDLCLKKPQEIFDSVYEKGKQYRVSAKGYALGSGNSIPDYIPVDGYLAMIEAGKKIRMDE